MTIVTQRHKKKPIQTQCSNTKRPHIITEMTKIDNIIAWSMNTIFILNELLPKEEDFLVESQPFILLVQISLC